MLFNTFASRCFLIKSIALIATFSVASCVQAQWTAYNDHRPSTLTSPNATGYDMIFNAAPMPLKDFASGANISAELIVSQTGTPDDFGGNNYPNAGTPAYDFFNGIVDVGDAGIPGIRNSSSTSITLTFSNLNPGNFYKFRGTTVRGNSYVDRWSVFSLQGVGSFVDAHVDGSANNNLITIGEFPTATLTNGQVALNSGENREGSIIGWDDIVPGTDGTFSIRAEQYMGPTPFGNTANASTAYGYGFTAIYLEEIIGELTPIAITAQPQSLSLGERGLAKFTVEATGSPIRYYWYSNDVLIAENNQASFTIPSAAFPGNNGAQFYCVLSNSLNSVTSDTATLTVVQDTTPPTVVSVLGDADAVTVRVSFSEPMLVDTVGEFNFAVFPTGTDPGASPILVYGATLENETNIVLTTDPRTPGQNYSLQVTDVADNSSRQNVIDPNPTIITNFAQNVLLIGFDVENVWSYNINEGSLDGTGWEQPAYDDSAWPTGPSGLGLDPTAGTGTGAGLPQQPILTPLPYAANGVVTYFRKHFTLPSPTNGVVLTLQDCVEDGAVYYLNGQLVFTNRMPAGPYTFTTLASGAPDPTPTTGPFSLSITNLHSGDNVLAVAVYQSSATSSDIELSVQLSARVTQFAGGPPVIGGQPQGHPVNEGQPLVLSVEADGALPLSFQWYKDGNILPTQTSAILSIAAAVPSDAGSYTVVVANSINSVTSSGAAVTVNADTTAPVFLSAVADTNLTNIVLTFGERLDAVSAENVAHYNVFLTAGPGAALTIESAAVNGTNVILTTSPRTQSQGYTIVLNNVYDTAVAQNPVTPSTLPVNCGIIILAPDATTAWRYNTASNDLDGIPWQTLGYDDSSWLTGLAGFTSPGDEFTTNGFEIQTTNMVAPSLGGPVTAYYRVPFTLPGSPVGASLHIVGVIDDGLVAYINGVEAGRLRVTNASPVSFTNLASASSPETSNVHLPLDTVILTNLSGLISGPNLLAIELHQNATTSSDAVLSVQLVAGLQSFAPVVAQPRLHITRNESTGQITLSWSEAGYSLQETATLSGNGPGTGWGASARQNGVPFTPAPGDDTHFYRLISN